MLVGDTYVQKRNHKFYLSSSSSMTVSIGLSCMTVNLNCGLWCERLNSMSTSRRLLMIHLELREMKKNMIKTYYKDLEKMTYLQMVYSFSESIFASRLLFRAIHYRWGAIDQCRFLGLRRAQTASLLVSKQHSVVMHHFQPIAPMQCLTMLSEFINHYNTGQSNFIHSKIIILHLPCRSVSTFVPFEEPLICIRTNG